MQVGTIFTAVTTVIGIVSAAKQGSYDQSTAAAPAGRTSERGHGKVIERRSGRTPHYWNYGRNDPYWDSPPVHRHKKPLPSIHQWCKVEVGNGSKHIGSASGSWDGDFVIKANGWTFKLRSDCSIESGPPQASKTPYWVTTLKI